MVLFINYIISFSLLNYFYFNIFLFNILYIPFCTSGFKTFYHLCKHYISVRFLNYFDIFLQFLAPSCDTKFKRRPSSY